MYKDDGRVSVVQYSVSTAHISASDGLRDDCQRYAKGYIRLEILTLHLSIEAISLQSMPKERRGPIEGPVPASMVCSLAWQRKLIQLP